MKIFLQKFWGGIRKVRFLLCIFFLWLPADSPQGAFHSLPPCEASPAPLSAWGALVFPDEPQFAWRTGQELIARSDFSSALCFLDMVQTSYPSTPQYWLDRGDALWALGKEKEAVSAWEKADPETSAAMTRLREGYERTGQWESAGPICDKWMQLHPDDMSVEYRCALMAAMQSPVGALAKLDQAAGNSGPQAKTASALAAAIRASEGADDLAYTFAVMGKELLASEELNLADAALRKAISLRPDYGDAHALLGLALEKQGENGGVEYHLGAQLSPDSETVCLFYGAWLRRTEQPDLARIWLQRAWSWQPGDWTVATELAELEFDSGNVSKGENWLLQSVQANPQVPAAWLALADFYIQHEIQVEQSGIPAARQAVLLAPQDPTALELLGRGYYQTSDFAEADSIFRRALALDPASASLHADLGLDLIQEGNDSEARSELEQAMQLDPHGEVGKAAQDTLNRMQ